MLPWRDDIEKASLTKSAWLGAVFLPLAFGAPLSAQGRVSGEVVDASNREPVAGAAVRLVRPDRADTMRSTSSEAGYFVFPPVPEGSWRLSVSFLGYFPRDTLIEVGVEPMRIGPIALELNPIAIRPLVVTSRRGALRGALDPPGLVTLDTAVIRYVPPLGEYDVLRTMSVLPGLSTQSDFSTGIFIRGNSPDKSPLRIDGAPVINPFHLGGIFSAIHGEAIQEIRVDRLGTTSLDQPGVGGRVDLTMRRGDAEETSVFGGLGLISSHLGAEGPIGDDATFFLSGRRTYLDFLSKLTPAEEFPYQFSDLYGKVSWDLSAQHRLSLTGYLNRESLVGSDEAIVNDEVDWEWGSDLLNLRYSGLVGPGRAEAGTYLSRFAGDFLILGSEPSEPPDLDALSTMDVWGLHGGFFLPLGRGAVGLSFRSETRSIRHRFEVEDPDLEQNFPSLSLAADPWFVSGLAEWEVEGADSWRFGGSAGLQYADPAGATPVGHLYAEHTLRPGIRLNAVLTRKAQDLISIRNEEALLASLFSYDLWHPASGQPLVSWEGQLGLSWELGDAATAEVLSYARRFDDVPIPPLPGDIEAAAVIVSPDSFRLGRERAIGVEATVEARLSDNVDVLASYEISDVRRTLGDTEYVPRFHRRHVLSLLGRTEWAGWTFSSVLSVRSGQPHTPIVGVIPGVDIEVDGRITGGRRRGVLGEYNSETLPWYSRLDIATRRDFDVSIFGVGGVLSPYVSVINAFNQKNVLRVESRVFGEPTLRFDPQVPIVPSFGLQWRF